MIMRNNEFDRVRGEWPDVEGILPNETFAQLAAGPHRANCVFELTMMRDAAFGRKRFGPMRLRITSSFTIGGTTTQPSGPVR
jgi:hypothetical protein